ncbi:MAG TPA: DUF5130 family protein [Acidothermaceae bacterium]|nr:DUF5130 family protein [Acidothermaceae bacterium]
MPVGDAFTQRQADQIRQALASARAETGLLFSVYIGSVDGEVRDHALQLHASLGDDAAIAVLTFIEPEARRVEIVTGAVARRSLDDRAAALASLSMSTSFAGGDLAGGILSGIRMMAQSAAKPPVAHQHSAD